MGLLAAEITARTRRDPSELFEGIYPRTGRAVLRADRCARHTSNRKNLLKALSPDQLGIKELAGEPVRATLTAAPGNGQPFGGIKVIADNGWFAARPSGTEDVYKIYAESFRSEAHLRADPAGSPGRDCGRVREREGAGRRIIAYLGRSTEGFSRK